MSSPTVYRSGLSSSSELPQNTPEKAAPGLQLKRGTIKKPVQFHRHVAYPDAGVSSCPLLIVPLAGRDPSPSQWWVSGESLTIR